MLMVDKHEDETDLLIMITGLMRPLRYFSEVLSSVTGGGSRITINYDSVLIIEHLLPTRASQRRYLIVEEMQAGRGRTTDPRCYQFQLRSLFSYFAN